MMYRRSLTIPLPISMHTLEPENQSLKHNAYIQNDL